MATEAARTDQYDIIEEPVAETDNSVEARKAVSDKLLGIHNVISNRFWQFAALTGVLFILGIIGYVMRLSSGFREWTEKSLVLWATRRGTCIFSPYMGLYGRSWIDCFGICICMVIMFA